MLPCSQPQGDDWPILAQAGLHPSSITPLKWDRWDGARVSRTARNASAEFHPPTSIVYARGVASLNEGKRERRACKGAPQHCWEQTILARRQLGKQITYNRRIISKNKRLFPSTGSKSLHLLSFFAKEGAREHRWLSSVILKTSSAIFLIIFSYLFPHRVSSPILYRVRQLLTMGTVSWLITKNPLLVCLVILLQWVPSQSLFSILPLLILEAEFTVG